MALKNTAATAETVAPVAPTVGATINAVDDLDARIKVEPAGSVAGMTLQERLALMAELRQAQQLDVAPLYQRKVELEVELDEVNHRIQAIQPANDALSVFRAVRNALKVGTKTLDEVVQAAGQDAATVEAMLTKHLVGKDGKSPMFVLKDGEFGLNPKARKSV